MSRCALALWTLAFTTPGAAAAQQNPAAVTVSSPAAAAMPPADVITRDAGGKPTLRAFRIDQPIRTDAVLDEEVYQRIPAISGFIQQVPRNGEPATEQTDVWLLYDAKNLYVTARCHDSQPDRLVMDEMRRDASNIFQNENFTVVLDTFNDQRNAFWFQVNPLSAMRDQVVIDEVQNLDWNTVVYVKSARTADGWVTEIAIPFKSLRYPGAGPQTWGINLRRIVRWKNEVSTISLVPAAFGLPGLARLSLAGTLVGLETPGESMNLEVKPYVLGTMITDRTATPAVDNDLTRNAGFDFKYGLTRGLIADFTYNTDFAQVEEDLQQVNLTRFNLQFREKRDFFLEGQGLFAFGSPTNNVPVLFFSRQIGLSDGQPVPVVAGGRLTGKAGRYSIGALNIQTDDKPSANAVSTNFAVVRLKRDILRRSNIGMIFTRRTPAVGRDASNIAGGIDVNLLLYQYVTVNGYLARTRTEGLDGEDVSYRGRFDYGADRYGLAFEHLLVAPNFNPEIGFLRRADFRRNYAQARFSPRPNGRVIRKATWQASVDRITNAGRSVLETRESNANFGLEFQNSDRLDVDVNHTYEFVPKDFSIARGVVVPRGAYSYGNVQTSYSLGQQHRISGRLTVTRGTLYGGPGTEVGYSGRATVTRQFALEPSLTLNWVDLPFGSFTTTLIANRFVFMASPYLFVSSLVQFNAARHSLNSSVRLRWEYAPRSELFVVYSDGRDRTLDGRPEFLNRSFAVKLTRLFRF